MPAGRSTNGRSPAHTDTPPESDPAARPLGPTSARSDTARLDHAALAAALDPIITIDFTGRIRSASDSVERVLGWKPADIIGRNVSVLMPEPRHSAHDGYLQRYRSTGNTGILNSPRRFDALRRDGTLLPIELSVSRADIPGQSDPLFVGIIRDMSATAAVEQSREEHRVRAQQHLAEQTAALEAAHLRLAMADRMASIGTLAAGLGHDMNNVLLPVRARLNALRAAAHAGHIKPAEKRHVEQIRKSIAYLQQLADALHFLAMNPEQEGTEGAGSCTKLHDWWAQTGALLSKAVPKHVRLTASIPADTPRVTIAPHALTQAMLNLVVNAGEAIPPGRKRKQGRVQIAAQILHDHLTRATVRLTVTDNGTGMTPEVRRRAFEMFYTTKPRGLGTGLGLALVRRVVDHSGGVVDIESEPGKGTCVALMLPGMPLPEHGPKSQRTASSAVVSVADGRATGLIRQFLEAAGLQVVRETQVNGAGLWIADPACVTPDQVSAWRDRHADSRLILFGTPDPSTARAWDALNPDIIKDPADLEQIRAAVRRAIAGTPREKS